MSADVRADYPHEPGTLYDCAACERIMIMEVADDDDPDDHELGCTCIFCTPGA